MKKKDCSIVTAQDVASWCNRVGISFENFVKKNWIPKIFTKQ